MPPHCDSLDGPVVTMARKALEAEDVRLILPYVPAAGEAEVTQAFAKVLPLHKLPNGAEGAPYTGLKPAGLDVGPVIPVAERAIETGSVDELAQLLTDIVHAEVIKRFEHMRHLQQHAAHGVEAAREYVEAMLGLQVWSHQLYLAALAKAHECEHKHG
jgi:hypothetical protein